MILLQILILYAYDANGRLSAQTSRNANGADAITLTYKYDKNGNLRYETDGRGTVTTYTYDALNRAISMSNTVGGVVRTSQKTYDANGNVTIETDWYGNTNKYAYDPLGRVITRTDANNVVVETLTYNENGVQTASKDALNNVTSYVYDNFNRLTSVIDDDNNVLYTYEYDANDNLLTQTDRAGTTTTMTYNVRNLVVTRTGSGLSDASRFIKRFNWELGDYMTYTNIIKILFVKFPFLEQKYLEEGDYIWGLAHLCFPIICIPYIREIVKNNETGAIIYVCEFLEDMAICTDKLVNELLVVSILENILAERGLIETLRKYFKFKTNEWLLSLEKTYGWV